jgi:Tfp pilus assembly protein PilN
MTATVVDTQADEHPLIDYDALAYQAPKVNLLPPEIADRHKLRKLQAGLGGVALAAVAVVGLLYMQAGSGKTDAQARLDAARGLEPGLQSQTQKLANVPAEKAQIEAAGASLKAAMSSEVLWSDVMDNFRRYLPDGVRMTSLATTAVTPTAAVAGTSKPNAIAATKPSNVIATVQIAGRAVDLNAVAAELDELAKVPGLTNVYLTTTTKSVATGTQASVADFTATADITNVVLSHRYDTGAAK